MKKSLRKFLCAAVLIAMCLGVTPAFAQAPTSSIPPNAQKAKQQLLDAYAAALASELANGQTAIDPQSGAKVLVGDSAAKMDLLWSETVRQIEALIARPAAERLPIENKIAAIDGSQPVYVLRSGFPYSASVQVEEYQTSEYNYFVDIETAQILEIMPIDSTHFRRNASSGQPVYAPETLENLALGYIGKIAGKVDLESLQLIASDKGGRNYFFRWEDPTGKLPDGGAPFIQVGLSVNGDLLNYVNTLPVALDPSYAFLQQFGLLPLNARASFNELYANGGGYWSWVNGGASSSTISNAGYCYYAGWCSPKNFYWGYTDATTSPNTPYIKGMWDVNPSSQYIYLDAYVPNTHADAYSAYTATYNNGANYETAIIDQSIYSNVWVRVLGPHFNYGVVTLDNDDDSANWRVAWDEILLCTSDQCP